MDEPQVAKSKHPDKMVRGGGRVSVRHRVVGVEEDGEIEEFFGQMWWFSSTPQPRVNQSPISTQCWIYKDLWDSKTFLLKDFFPVQPSDVLREDPKTASFARDFWGKGEKESFM
jgi:hypothetical protein